MTGFGVPQSRNHCAIGGRSWTDFITNRVLLSGFDINEYIAEVATRKFPGDLLSPVLHELTHHSCFDSIVGASLSALHMRARRYAFLTKCEKPADLQLVLEDLIRYEAATRLLRPLAEGLALFAEFDVVPGNSEALSTVVCLAMLLFGEHAEPKLSYNALLQRLRFRKQFVRHKMSLLMEPFSCESGYLPGYMAVKYLWQQAVKQSELALDRDLFFMYLRSFFYDDPGFATVILNASTAEMESANAIGIYFQDRIQTLMRIDVEDALRRYERWVVSPDRRGTPEGISTDGRLNGDAYNERIQEVLVSMPSQDDDCLTVAAHDYMTLEERNLLHLGNQHVIVNVHAPGEASVTDDSGRQLPAGKLIAPLSPGIYDGTLSVILSTHLTQFAFVVVIGEQVAVARSIIGGEGESWEPLCRSAVNRPTNEDLEPVLKAR